MVVRDVALGERNTMWHRSLFTGNKQGDGDSCGVFLLMVRR